MKKLISLLLAVSVMAASTVAFAADLTAAGDQRNDGYNVMPQTYVEKEIPTYRPGDIITFKGSNSVTFTTGDVVTFISSKVDANIDDTTVMFIDQVTVTANEVTSGFTYKVREGLTQGAYKLDIKNGSDEKATFYYFVAAPEVKIATVDLEGTDNAFTTADGTAFVGVLTMGTDEVASYEQVGLGEFGMDLSYNGKKFEKRYGLPNIGEIEGSVNWYFAVEITDLPTGATVDVADYVAE